MSEEQKNTFDKAGIKEGVKAEIKTEIKKDLIALGVFFAVLFVILKIVFYKENLVTVLRTAAAFMLTSILPGFVIMEYWHTKLEAIERIAIGAIVGFSTTGILSYYLSLLGVNINLLTFLLPTAVIVISGAVVLSLKKPFSHQQDRK